MKKLLITSVAAIACASGAMAAPKTVSQAPAISAPSSLWADTNSPFKAGDFMVRARALEVIPYERDGANNTSLGGTLGINNTVVPEMDFSYFFTPNVSAELIAAVTKHSVKHSSGADVGSAWLLPPTLTVQYHITQLSPYVIPYVGAGVNYTHFFDEKGGALGTAEYKDSFGGALQAGADIPLQGNWYANVDVKKVYIGTTAKFSSGARANVDIDPLLVGLGVGYKF